MEQLRLAIEKEKNPEVLPQEAEAKELDEVEANIEKLESDFQAADAIIQEENKQLEKVLFASSKHIQKESSNLPNLRFTRAAEEKKLSGRTNNIEEKELIVY